MSANDQGIKAQIKERVEVYSLKCIHPTTILPTYYAKTDIMFPEESTKSKICKLWTTLITSKAVAKLFPGLKWVTLEGLAAIS